MTEPTFSERVERAGVPDTETETTSGLGEREPDGEHADVYATADEPALPGETAEERDARLYPPAPSGEPPAPDSPRRRS